MTFRSNHTQWKGIQLGYEDHIGAPTTSREDLYCLTFTQSQALLAVIELWRWTTRWYSEGEIDSAQVDSYVNDIQRRLMMPCGSDNDIILSQWTSDGHYQESSDGGVTYHDAPSKDPRNNVPLPPPFLPPGTTDESCTYADSVVNNIITNWLGKTGATEDQQTVIEGILGFLAGIFGAFGVIAAAITLGIAAVIVAFGVAAWKAAFTSDVWDRLRCNIANQVGDDGSFDQEAVDAVWNQIASDETGIAAISLQGMVAALGPQGMTIAARQGWGSPTADCDCEECEGCDLSGWIIQESGGYVFGVLDEESSTCDVLVIDQTVVAGDSNYYVKVFAPTNMDCCTPTSLSTSGSPSGLLIAWDEVGETQGTFAHTGSVTDITGHCIVSLLVRTSTSQTVTLSTAP